MKGMNGDETASYIRHHLEEAGRTADLFTDDAVTQIHHNARSKPRTLNNVLADSLAATALNRAGKLGQTAVTTRAPLPGRCRPGSSPLTICLPVLPVPMILAVVPLLRAALAPTAGQQPASGSTACDIVSPETETVGGDR